MQLKPVKKYTSPCYPTKKVLIENPELLKKLPSRWENNVYVCITVSSLLMVSISGCSIMKDNDTKDVLTPKVFVHGEGNGSFGCMSVSPPVFLSEEEAFQVICEEARTYGIDFKKDELKLNGVKVPVTSTYYDFDNENPKIKSKKADLIVDGYDKAHNIGFEFVSTDDCIDWGKNQHYKSTVEVYTTLEAANVLREGLAKTCVDKSIGVFYDPIPFENDVNLSEKRSTEEVVQDLKKESIENLRLQIKDFLDWLKSQDII